MYIITEVSCQEQPGGWAMKTRYRVWIVRYEGRQPDVWLGVPAGAVAVEPAERRTMTARQARPYVEAFNRTVQKGPRKVWAVALPVAICYAGEPQPGERVADDALTGADLQEDCSAHEKSPLLACQVSACNGLPPRELT